MNRLANLWPLLFLVHMGCSSDVEIPRMSSEEAARRSLQAAPVQAGYSGRTASDGSMMMVMPKTIMGSGEEFDVARADRWKHVQEDDMVPVYVGYIMDNPGHETGEQAWNRIRQLTIDHGTPLDEHDQATLSAAFKTAYEFGDAFGFYLSHGITENQVGEFYVLSSRQFLYFPNADVDGTSYSRICQLDGVFYQLTVEATGADRVPAADHSLQGQEAEQTTP